ncbi:MAG: bifunctional precorrin-2 dehydrogenase/sirohydrochlorin ferrochelatase [Dysosmobacter welbionis]
MDLQGKAGLVVGAGAVAGEVEKLLPFGARLRVVAPEICPALRELPGVTLDQRLPPGGSGGRGFAVAAAGNIQVDQQVARLCQDGIPVNTADGGEGPSSFRRSSEGMLTVGVSTGGEPRAAACLRDRMEAALPDGPRRSSCACMHTGSVSAPARPPAAAGLAAAWKRAWSVGVPEPAEQERLEEYRTGGERK